MSKKRLRNYKNLKIAQTESVLYFSFDCYTPFYLHKKGPIFFFFSKYFFFKMSSYDVHLHYVIKALKVEQNWRHTYSSKPLHFSLQFQFFFNGSLQKKLRRWLSWLWLWQGIFFTLVWNLELFKFCLFSKRISTCSKGKQFQVALQFIVTNFILYLLKLGTEYSCNLQSGHWYHLIFFIIWTKCNL